MVLVACNCCCCCAHAIRGLTPLHISRGENGGFFYKCCITFPGYNVVVYSFLFARMAFNDEDSGGAGRHLGMIFFGGGSCSNSPDTLLGKKSKLIPHFPLIDFFCLLFFRARDRRVLRASFISSFCGKLLLRSEISIIKGILLDLQASAQAKFVFRSLPPFPEKPL